jgi:Protein of unknown function (DUF2442)
LDKNKKRLEAGGEAKCEVELISEKKNVIMNKIIPYLKKAEPRPGYLLFVEFEDGLSGVIDLSKWKGKGVFAYWNDEMNFKKVKITVNRKLEWNGDIDMDPDAFYLQLKGKTFEEYALNKQFLRNSD